MRRIDVMFISLGLLIAGGLIYLLLQVTGMDGQQAGIWTQALLVGGLIIWLLTYLGRVLTQNMAYNQQIKDYREAVVQKRLEELTPEELAKLQAEIEQEKSQG